MRRFRQGDAPVILYSPRGIKLFDFGLNRIIETDDEDLSNLLLAMGAIEIPPVVPPVPQDLTEVAARINALDGRVVVIEGRADIKSVGTGLSLSGAGELSATGSGSGGQGPPGEKGADGYSPTVAVTDITGGHRVTITDVQGPHAFDVLDGGGDSYTKAETDAILASKSFVATYNVTTAQELIGYLDSAKEPFAPILVKRGSDYYTAALATKSGDDKVIVRVIGSGSGDYIVFNYTITGNIWASSSYVFQKKLESGASIKTVNNQSLLGSGNIDISGGGGGNSFLITKGTTTYTEIEANKGKEFWFADADEPTYAARPVIACVVREAQGQAYVTVWKTVNSNEVWVVDKINGWSLAQTNPFARTSELGDLSSLNTTAQTDVVSAINELKFSIDGLGEPFRVKQWQDNSLNITIPSCTQDATNINIPKLTYTISGEEGEQYQIAGMIAYEIFDASSGGNRINFIPVCQFTGNDQKELSVRGCVMGPNSKVAKRISAWVLLKHR